ncbi:RHOMBOID-like protein 14 [Euphorbia peplus]|nr:RHOMBOID-like protein 14 [Euphorbia peplus]
MISLMWKGVQLETSMGSSQFASMVASLLTISQGISLLLSNSLLLFFHYPTPFYSEYAVGFSGVLFAMKVVLNSQSHHYTFLHGLILPARHAAWAELLLIQMFVPRVSFLGHLAGILAGLLYLNLKGRSPSDPLTSIIKSFRTLFTWPFRFARGMFQHRRQRISGRGTVGGNTAGRSVLPLVWRCQACTYDNSSWLGVCEMCGTDRGGSQVSPQPEDLILEEMRRRRMERFGH